MGMELDGKSTFNLLSDSLFLNARNRHRLRKFDANSLELNRLYDFDPCETFTTLRYSNSPLYGNKGTADGLSVTH